jgi:hypothetical protein
VIPYNALNLEFANFKTPCTFVIENLKLSFLDVVREMFFFIENYFC